MTLRDTQATDLTAPLSASIDADVASAVLETQDGGTIRVGCYVDGLVVPDGWGEDEAPDASRLWTRSGTAVGSGWRIDYGTSTARMLLSTGLYEALQVDYEFQGLNVGGLLGGRGEMGYDPPTGERGHVPHGGRYRTQGVRQALAFSRSPAGWLAADAVQEHLIGSVDIVSEGSHLPPGLGLLAEETCRAMGVTDVDPTARHMSPPLWAIVHGERSQAGRLIPPLTVLGEATNLFHPYNAGQWPGVTRTEWNQMLAFQIAQATAAGHLPILQQAVEHFAHRIGTIDADDAGCVQLLRQCLALLDMAGEWGAKLTKAALPLTVQAWNETNLECGPECGGGPAVIRNPLYDVRKISPVVVADCMPPGMERYSAGPECSAECSEECSVFPATTAAGWGMAHQAFAVPRVLPSLWWNGLPLVLVVINWTAEDSTSKGWFAPWLRAGWGGPVSRECSAECDRTVLYDVERLNADGTTTAIAADLADATHLLCSGISGTLTGQELSLGSVPAYSVQAYRLSQAG